MGKKLMITEKLISQLIGYEHTEFVTTPANRRDMDAICAEVFLSEVHSNKIKDLKPGYKIWARIFLGCFFHRKASNSPDYINNEQLYLLHCIRNDVLVDLPHILFNHLWTHVKETREPTKLKSAKPRDWIPREDLSQIFSLRVVWWDICLKQVKLSY